MEKIKIFGDEFEVEYKRTFPRKNNLEWKIARVSDSQVIVCLPIAYGDEEIKNLLNTKYLYNYAKSVADAYYFVVIQDVPVELIINELNKF